MKIIATLALFVVLVLFGAVYFSSGGAAHQANPTSTTLILQKNSTTTAGSSGNSTTTLIHEANITVSGKINVSGSGMHPISISFYRANPNRTYSTNIIGPASYAISLPNLNTYDVVVFWAGQYPWQKGFVPVKPAVWQFDLGLVNQTNTTYNLNFTLPNGLINVSGRVRMLSPNITPSGQVLRAPTQVIFKAGNGMKFVGNIITYNITSQTNPNQTSHQYIYNASVPNLNTYNVTVNWNGQYDTKGTCYENVTSIYTGVGVANLTENYVC